MDVCFRALQILLPKARELFYFSPFFLFVSVFRGSSCKRGNETEGERERETVACFAWSLVDAFLTVLLKLKSCAAASSSSSTWCAAVTLGDASVARGDLTTDSGCRL